MILLLVMTFYCCSLLNFFTALEINVDPAELVIGRTRRLHVQCSLKREVNSPLATIFSIVMSHSRQETQPKFLYLASVNNVDGKTNGIAFNTTTAFGVINNKGESFLKLTWQNPSKVRAGVYKCEVTGVNKNGIRLTISNTATVRSTKHNVTKAIKIPPNMKINVEQVEAKLQEIQECSDFQDTFQKNMTLYIDQTDAKFQALQQSCEVQDSFRENMTRYVGQADAKLHALEINSEVENSFLKNMTRYVDQIDAKLQAIQQSSEAQDSFQKNMSGYVGQTNAKLHALQQNSEVENSFRKNMTRYVDQTDVNLLALKQSSDAQTLFQKNTLLLMLQSLFYVLPTRTGRKYYLSRQATYFTQAVAQEICKMYGGYLVEFNSYDEFTFLRVYLLNKNVSMDYVMTGGSDAVAKGFWVNTYSKTPVRDIIWSPNEPSRGLGKNCQCFWKFSHWLINDCICVIENDNYEYGYMCEIPE